MIVELHTKEKFQIVNIFKNQKKCVKSKPFLSDTAGFSLVELIIVIAILAVLMAILSPVFSKYLERSRESTDLASARNFYSEIMSEVALGNTGVTATFKLKQKNDNWQIKDPITLAGITHSKIQGDTDNWKGIPGKGGSCTISYDTTIKNGAPIGVVYNWSGGSGSSIPEQPLSNDIKSFWLPILLIQVIMLPSTASIMLYRIRIV